MFAGCEGRRISPSRVSLDELRTPLEPGERAVLDFFDQHLPPAWEIYVQPFLNGLRPDFVLLNEAVGVGIFEVKDWNLASGAYRSQSGGIRVRNASGHEGIQRSPLRQVLQYRDELLRLYCPRLGKKGAIAAGSAGVIFPVATTVQAQALLDSQLAAMAPEAAPYVPVSGGDALRHADLHTVFPEASRQSSKYMNPHLAADLRAWLSEPRTVAERRGPVRLDTRQRELAQTRTTTGFRRIRGPAGSCKTLVLASRAAQLAGEDKDILVVSFNHTLRNYIADMVVQSGGKRNAITWLGFHEWCRRTLEDVDAWENYNDERRGQTWLDHGCAEAVIAELGRAAVPSREYDAILVDEGQDFFPDWWEALRRMLRDGGEMMLVADVSQDIYERRSSWTEGVMRDAGFTGPWADLTGSYRLPPELRVLLCDFLVRFGTDDALPPGDPPAQQTLQTCQLAWVQTGQDQLVAHALAAVDRSLVAAAELGTGSSDLCVLADSVELGRKLRDALVDRHDRLTHTFGETEEQSRDLKKRFSRRADGSSSPPRIATRGGRVPPWWSWCRGPIMHSRMRA